MYSVQDFIKVTGALPQIADVSENSLLRDGNLDGSRLKDQDIIRRMTAISGFGTLQAEYPERDAAGNTDAAGLP